MAGDAPTLTGIGRRCVLERPSLVRGARWAVLTPNKPEYGRLAGALSGDAALDPADRDWLFSDPRVTSIASRGSLVSRPTEIAPSSRWRSRSETREGRARRSSKRGRPARLCNGPSAYQLVHESLDSCNRRPTCCVTARSYSSAPSQAAPLVAEATTRTHLINPLIISQAASRGAEGRATSSPGASQRCSAGQRWRG